MSKNSAEFSESKKENTNIEEPQERKECTKIEESQIKDGEDKKENILKSRKFLVSVNLGLLIMAVIVTYIGIVKMDNVKLYLGAVLSALWLFSISMLDDDPDNAVRKIGVNILKISFCVVLIGVSYCILWIKP